MSMDTTSNSSEVEQPPTLCLFLNHSQNATRFALVVSLSIFILYQAFQQWQQHRSFSTTSHSDIFTFHNAVVDILWALGTVIYHWFYYIHIHWVYMVGVYLIAASYLGQGFFHVLTCVEHYLAVVHPVTYRGLKNSRGVRIRDFTIGCVWLLSFAMSFVTELGDINSHVVTVLIMLGLSLIINSFCCVSVLCVLIRPKPGDGGGVRERINQSKLRAFYTIMAILGALWLWVMPFFLNTALSKMMQRNEKCVTKASVFWLNLPSCLVLPLLYLHRTGRLACCHSN